MTLPRRVQIAVVGAGPAGSTLAAALAMLGRDVALFERKTFPRDKVCGEFLSPEVTDCLHQLGCLEAFYEFDPPAMTQSRLTLSDGAELNFSLPGVAYGLSRTRLDDYLFKIAREKGAQAFDGVAMRGLERGKNGRTKLCLKWGSKRPRRSPIVEADVVVGAYGRRSAIDRRLGRPFFDERSPYVAFKRHHRIARDADVPSLDSVVELHAFDGGYCGVSFVEGGRVNVCTMMKRRLLSDDVVDAKAPFESLAAADTALGRRLATLAPCETKICTAAQIPLTTKRSSCRDILFVGDAAGMIAPLAGDGQAMAMQSALRLAELLHHHLPRVPRRRWAWLWRRRYEPRIRLGQWLQGAMIRPRIANAVAGVLGRIPSLGQQLIAATRTTR